MIVPCLELGQVEFFDEHVRDEEASAEPRVLQDKDSGLQTRVCYQAQDPGYGTRQATVSQCVMPLYIELSP